MGSSLSSCYASSHESETTIVLPGVETVAIVGGGLAGFICAYYCAKNGKHVEVFERKGQVGAATAYGPAGVTMWKPVKRGLKWSGTVDPLAGGFHGFANYFEGSTWQLLDKDPRRPSLMLAAQQVHAEFVRENPDAQNIMHDDGLMYILDEELFKENQALFKGDPSMVFYTKDEFERSEWFAPMYEGCSYYGVLWSKEEGAIDPHRFVLFLSERVQSMGGKVHVNSTVTRLEEVNYAGKVVVHLPPNTAQSLPFDAAIVSVGAATHPGDLLQASGIQDPVDEIYGVKGYTVTGRMPKGFLKMGVVDAVDTKFIRPWIDNRGQFCIRAGSIADPFDPDEPYAINWDRLDEFRDNQFIQPYSITLGIPVECQHTFAAHGFATASRTPTE
ncbi:unnamed protein product [Prorocentrum cordatum]|uniref:FAD dependent oxidoreductase domain-containing protein n=1 Tax=Prorocentrum cordatum TaxID=2364126 RepID=A0ABN9SM24_9DINO|nr:unnamed protein product [Polarella glacialis]